MKRLLVRFCLEPPFATLFKLFGAVLPTDKSPNVEGQDLRTVQLNRVFGLALLGFLSLQFSSPALIGVLIRLS